MIYRFPIYMSQERRVKMKISSKELEASIDQSPFFQINKRLRIFGPSSAKQFYVNPIQDFMVFEN